MIKYYAVKKGLTPGIYTDWVTCKKLVDGFPGAEYKSFKTREEALDYLGICDEPAESSSYEIPSVPLGCAAAYVDGSFKAKAHRFAYGIIMFVNKSGATEEIRAAKSFANEELLEMRNVAGEIMGAAEAMKRAREMGLSEITIYHDYEGIAAWCTGKWKANKTWTQKYRSFYNEIIKDIAVHFSKVKGHSGDTFNEIADELAKGALDEFIC